MSGSLRLTAAVAALIWGTLGGGAVAGLVYFGLIGLWWQIPVLAQRAPPMAWDGIAVAAGLCGAWTALRIIAALWHLIRERWLLGAHRGPIAAAAFLLGGMVLIAGGLWLIAADGLM